MKNATLIEKLNAEANRFTQLAKAHLFHAYHRAEGVNDDDRRKIRDHEIRAETFRAARALIAGD